MSVNRQEYIVVGCKLNGKFTNKLWAKEDRDELDSKYEWDKKREKHIQYLTDGMNGDYTFFGFIKQISDGWESDSKIIEFKEPTEEKKKQIEEKFKELFPKEEMPAIKMYYLPHYT